MIENKYKISSYIANQLPSYIVEEHVTFKYFLEAYYEWLETNENPYHKPFKTLDYRDIDNTLDIFIEQIKNELMHLFPKKIDKELNVPRLLKNIKQFYEAKGTVKSIKFLFRILFNEEIDISRPSDLILLASDGKWIQKKSVKVANTNGNIQEVLGSTIYQKKPVNVVPELIVEPLSKEDIIFGQYGFNQVVDVFGIKIYAENKFSKTYIRKFASMLATIIDSSLTGYPQQQAILDKLIENKVSIVLRNELASEQISELKKSKNIFDVYANTTAFASLSTYRMTDELQYQHTRDIINFVREWALSYIDPETFGLTANEAVHGMWGEENTNMDVEELLMVIGGTWTVENWYAENILYWLGYFAGQGTGGDSMKFSANTELQNLLTLNSDDLPADYPYIEYNPSANNTDPNLATETVSFGRVTGIQKYRIKGHEIYELFLDDIVGTFDGQWPLRYELNNEIYHEELYRVFAGIVFSSGGFLYEENEPIYLSPETISYTTTDEDSFGNLYDQGFVAEVRGRGGRGVIGRTGDNGSIEKVRVTNSGVDYEDTQHIITIKTNNGVAATGNIYTSWQTDYVGLWESDDGKLNTIKRLRDNDKYHEFSYVIESVMTLEKYKNALKKLVHPAGTKVFGDVAFTSSLDFDIILSSAATFYEQPLIGNYGPYTFNTETDLRLWVGTDDVDSGEALERAYSIQPNVDLYPAGFNSVVGPVSESGSTAHDPGTDGPLDSHVDSLIFTNVPPIDDVASINTYWVVYPHPYSRYSTIDNTSATFSSIQLKDFLSIEITDESQIT